MVNASKCKIGKFEDDVAEIIRGGVVIGTVERFMGERFASVSSRRRITFVDHYEVDIAEDPTSPVEYPDLAAVRAYLATRGAS